MQIIVKNYEHLNKAFGNWDTPQGVYVKNKDHYDRLMKEGGYTSYDESRSQDKGFKGKPYVTSQKALDIIKAAKNSKDKKGRVNLSDRTIDAMREIGAIDKKIPDYMKMPSNTKSGGFYSDDKPKKEYAQGFSL